jgi:spermidine synthase
VLASGAAFYAPVYQSADALLAAVRETELLYYRDGVSSTISVDRQGNHRFYRTNGKTDASTDPGDMANQILLGHLPMLLHPDPADVFILGLGTGVTAGAVARYPVRSIEIVDIEPAAREATRFFEAENRRVLADPRARLITADGRNALLARPRTYDVIISDPSDLWVAGVGTLFTREFYEVARSRLRPGGIMVQWIHTHAILPAQLKLIVATFRSAFPATSLWRPNRGDIILMGSVAPVVWDYDRLRQVDDRNVATVALAESRADYVLRAAAMAASEGEITAPETTAQQPRILEFLLDASLIPSGHGAATIEVFRNGSPVAPCAVAGSAVPRAAAWIRAARTSLTNSSECPSEQNASPKRSVARPWPSASPPQKAQ